jgi:hypothetical protein
MAKKTYSKFLTLTKTDLFRSIRDAFVIGVLGTVLAILGILADADLGAYTGIVSALITFVTAIINRWLNILRV